MTLNKIIRSLLLFPGVLLWSCGDLQPDKFDASAVRSHHSSAFTHNTGNMLQYYFQLKDALVAEQSKAAGIAAQHMNASLTALSKDSSVFADASLQQIIDSMRLPLEKIIAVKDENYEQQRIFFAPLSNTLYSFLNKAGITHTQAYHHFCPMALNEQGAYWLSTSSKIRNPYFGKKMLTCGELVDTLP